MLAAVPRRRLHPPEDHLPRGRFPEHPMTAAADQNPLFVPSLPPATQPRISLVPEGYAQKAMASLMQLHTELMDEKERRVELHRQLMEKEQALAELKMYVKLLEEKVEQRPPPRLRT